MVAPTGLRERFLQLVDREAEHAAAGRPVGHRPEDERARRPGVRRGAVSRVSGGGRGRPDHPRRLHAGPRRPGAVERIRVRSIIGEFLEHSRIWRFENGGEPEWLIGSGDLMDRNLDRRIEAFVPIDDPEARRLLDENLAAMLADDRRAWSLAGGRATGSGSSGSRGRRARRCPAACSSAPILAPLEGATPHRPHAGLGSLEPWA